MNWYSIHCFPHETPDVFLARGIRPLLEQHIWPLSGARAFFVRYHDDSCPHIRLRVRGEAAWFDETFRPAVTNAMEARGDFQEMPYEPETARYGGPDTLPLAEEYFHLSSRVALDLMNKAYTYGDAMFDTLRMQLIALHSAKLSRMEAAVYVEKLTKEWISAFFQADDVPADKLQEDVLKQFDAALVKQYDVLKNTLLELWNSLDDNKLDLKQTAWVRWVRGNQLILPAFEQQLDMVMPSLLHMNNNRLGIANPDEAYGAYVLWQCLKIW